MDGGSSSDRQKRITAQSLASYGGLTTQHKPASKPAKNIAHLGIKA